MKKRVAVIGAGPSGLSQLHAFHSDMTMGNDSPEVICFEKQDNWGGMWNYTWRTGSDEFGEPVHGSMYRQLWSNGPKECLEFADYSFDEHFGRPIASFPPRAVLYDYIEGRIKKSNVRECIRFHTTLRLVHFDESAQQFDLTLHDLAANHTYTERFDYLVIATGHFSTPNVPLFQGLETFPGRVMHSHDFRDAKEFAGKDVLLIGSSYSAEDIASQCWKYGCGSVTISYRSFFAAPLGYAWPQEIQEMPLLAKLVGKTAHFANGATKQFDVVILCTGYLHHFPFLPDSLRLQTSNRLCPTGLYNGVMWTSNPRLFCIGMQNQWYTFNMFDVQAWYVREIILGRLRVPSSEEMLEYSRRWDAKEKGLTPNDSRQAIELQGEYVQSLVSLTDYPDSDVTGMGETLCLWEADKKRDIMTFRDRPHRSLITGSVSNAHHVPWADAKDDSIEAYLRQS